LELCEDILKKIIFFIIIFFKLLAQDVNYNVELIVLEPDRKTPVENAKVIVAGKYINLNSKGKAQVKLPAGTYTFKILVGDKVETRTKEVSYENQVLTFLSSQENRGGITVLGEKEKVKLSRFKLEQEEIKRLPGSQGDSLKALQTLPGVFVGFPVGLTPTPQFNINITGQPYRNSDRGDFTFRGAGPRANQYYLDGFPMSYPFHLGGLSSVVNNNLIKDLEVYTGVFPSRFGYSTGGIVNIETKTEVKKNSYTWNISTFLTDASVELTPSENVFILAGGRKSYPNIFLLRAYPQGIPEDSKYADYNDFQLKYSRTISKSHKLTFISFGARDIQNYTKTQAEFESGKGRPDNRPPIGLDRSFVTNGIQYEYRPTDKFSNLTRISRNDFKEYFEVRFDSPLTAETIFGLANVTRQRLYYIENISNLEIIKKYINLEFGGQYRERKINLNAENISSRSTQFFDFFNNLVNSNPTFRALVDGDRTLAKETGGFIELQLQYQNLKGNFSTRYDHYQLSNDRRWSPRGLISYEIDSTKTTFSLGSGLFRNSPVGIEQISSKSGNPNLRMESAEHNVIGIHQEFWKDYLLKIEAFHNVFKDLVTYDNFISNPYALNNYPRDLVERPKFVEENPILPRALGYSNSADGYSRGIEIFLKKSPPKDSKTGFFGWISYSHSITKRNNHQPNLTSDEQQKRNLENGTKKLLGQTRVGTSTLNYYDDNTYEVLYDNDKALLFDLDRTHILNIIFGWKFSEAWQLGGRFRYATNVPITPIIDSNKATQAAAGLGINLYFPKYSQYYNSFRLEPVHQLDLRLDRFVNYEWGYMNWYIELINVYGRRNPTSQVFDNTRPYSSDNPRKDFDTLNSPYIQTTLPGGRLVYLPMVFFGLEVKF